MRLQLLFYAEKAQLGEYIQIQYYTVELNVPGSNPSFGSCGSALPFLILCVELLRLGRKSVKFHSPLLFFFLNAVDCEFCGEIAQFG